MSNDLCVVTAYCDTDKKVELLKKCIIDLMNKNEIYDTNEIEIYDTNEIEIYDTNKNVSKFIIRVTSATVLFIISCIVFSTL